MAFLSFSEIQRSTQSNFVLEKSKEQERQNSESNFDFHVRKFSQKI